jgi:hypothetical protein
MLSITHISFRQQESELNIGKPAEAAPHDGVARRPVIGPRQISSQSGDADQVG